MHHILTNFYTWAIVPALILILPFPELVGQNLQEKLGYEADAKLLIVHADDLGVSHSENAASFKGMEDGFITSASILMTTPWISEVAIYAKNHKKIDFGIHICMTSEWSTYKWGPVADPSKVSSLLNEQGYFYDNSPEFIKHAKADEVALEVKAQIERALDLGIEPTHVDAHMGAVYMRADILKEVVKLSESYGIPIAAPAGRLKAILPDLDVSEMVLPDRMYGASPQAYKSGMDDFYAKTLKNLEPGLSCIIIHAAYDDAEMQAICVGKIPWGSDWRQEDFDFFTSERCQKILAEENIHLISWREIQKKLKK